MEEDITHKGGLVTNCLPTHTRRPGRYQSLEQSSAYTLPTWAIPGAMANKKNNHCCPLPLQAGNLLWWAPVLEAHIYTLASFLCRPKTSMVGPSTGGPDLHTGPLPLQAENNYGGPQYWKPTSAHCPPSSAGRKSTMVGPITGGSQMNTLVPFLCRPEIHYGRPHRWRPPNQHTGPLSLQARKQLWWAPSLEAPKSTHWPPSSAGRKSSMVGPITGGPSQHTGPLPLQVGTNYYWPQSAGWNQLLVAPLCRPKSTTAIHSLTMVIPPNTPQ